MKSSSRVRKLRTLTSVNIDKVVGSGTFGVVFKAVDRESNRVLALKKIKMEKETQGFPITAIREIKLLKALNHDNIIHLREIIVYDASQDGEEFQSNGLIDGDVFMVFEFCDYDLSGLLRNPYVNLTEMHVKSYTKQLLTGVHYMHTNKILHRDIKGANLLVTKNNVLKIADWGLARSYHSETQKLTNPVVTQWYRSPELLLGATNYGPEIDIWSIGCMFAEMKSRTHTPLFQGKDDLNQLELIYQLCGSPTGEIEEIFAQLPNYEKMSIRQYQPRLARKFNSAYDKPTTELLENLLNLHPKKRISASKALDSDYFWTEGCPEPDQLPKFNIENAFSMTEDERIRGDIAKQELEKQKNLEERKLREESRSKSTSNVTKQPGSRTLVGGGGLTINRKSMPPSSKYKIVRKDKKDEDNNMNSITGTISSEAGGNQDNYQGNKTPPVGVKRLLNTNESKSSTESKPKGIWTFVENNDVNDHDIKKLRNNDSSHP